jgi:hypothetical protein
MADVDLALCPVCGRPNKPGRKYCGGCGSALPLICPNCGEANDPDDRFCGNYGAALLASQPDGRSQATPPRAAATGATPAADHPAFADKERRLVSADGTTITAKRIRILQVSCL